MEQTTIGQVVYRTICKIQKNNLREILIKFAQRKHLSYFIDKYNFIDKGSKIDVINELLTRVSGDECIYKDFREWLITFHMDGNNYFYVYDLKDLSFDKNKLILMSQNKNEYIKDISLINVNNLTETQLVNIKYEENKDRFIFVFLSPDYIKKKSKINENMTQEVLEKDIYCATAIMDFNQNQLIISINPTANLSSVDGLEKNEFSYIADFYRKKLMDIIGSFTISTQNWVFEALASLAEEATYHNNPKITEEYMKNIDSINTMIKEFLEKASLNDQASIEYMQEQTGDAFENILIDKYGVIDSGKDSYRVFEQKGDQLDTSMTVLSKTSTISQGRVAQLAKSWRDHSDLTFLGIERVISMNEVYRFLISIGEQRDHFKINSTRFVKEEVVYGVIQKLNSYKKQIESRP